MIGLVKLHVVETRNGRRGHDVAIVHEHGVIGARRGHVEAHDLVEQLQPRACVVGFRMQAPRDGLARLEAAQRLGRGHLKHQHLVCAQRLLGNAMARLHQRGLFGNVGDLDIGGVGHQLLDVDGVHAVVRPLVDHLEHVIAPDQAERDLQPARAPPASDGHFARREGHLITRDGHAFDDRAADLALRRLVEKRVIIALLHRQAPSLPRACRARWTASIGT